MPVTPTTEFNFRSPSVVAGSSKLTLPSLICCFNETVKTFFVLRIRRLVSDSRHTREDASHGDLIRREGRDDDANDPIIGIRSRWRSVTMLATAESELQRASVSCALVTIFRGKFCETLLQNREVFRAAKGSAIYDAGDVGRNFFFLRSGIVKVGAITDGGREIIYDLRKEGDVVGEL